MLWQIKGSAHLTCSESGSLLTWFSNIMEGNCLPPSRCPSTESLGSGVRRRITAVTAPERSCNQLIARAVPRPALNAEAAFQQTLSHDQSQTELCWATACNRGKSHFCVYCSTGGSWREESSSRLDWSPQEPALCNSCSSPPASHTWVQTTTTGLLMVPFEPEEGRGVGHLTELSQFICLLTMYAMHTPHFCTSLCLKKVINLKFIQSD